jgi:hypothetical protein
MDSQIGTYIERSAPYRHSSLYDKARGYLRQLIKDQLITTDRTPVYGERLECGTDVLFEVGVEPPFDNEQQAVEVGQTIAVLWSLDIDYLSGPPLEVTASSPAVKLEDWVDTFIPTTGS